MGHWGAMRATRRAPLPALVLAAGALAGPAPAAGEPTAALRQALVQAEEALSAHEPQIAESRYRTALLEGWLLKGALEVEEGRLEEARKAFERAASSAVETRRPHMSLALVELKLGGAERAVTLLRALMAQDRSDGTVRRLLPRALMAADEVDEAIQEMRELHLLAPQDLENTYALARAYLGQKRPEEAAELFAELAERRPIAETRILIGRTYRDFGHWDRAHRELEAALELDPQVRRANYYLGSVDLFDQGLNLLAEAMEHFEAELRVSPDDPMTNLYLGAALVEQRRPEEAAPRLERASRLIPGRPAPLQYLGRAYLALGRVEEAIAAFRRGLSIGEAAAESTASKDAQDLLQGQLSSLHYQLAQALRRSGDQDAAAVHFTAAKESSFRSVEGARELLDIYLQDEGSEDSVAASTWPLELTPLSGVGPQERATVERAVTRSLAQAYFNLGVLQTKAGRFARAAELYRQGLELEPRFPRRGTNEERPRLQYALGTALFNSGQFGQATAPLARALEEEPEDEILRRMLALAWFNSESYGEAAELLRDDPERRANPALEYTYAVALVRSGRAAEAEPVFARLLAENADWPELNVLLGQAHALEDDYETAVRYLERALELRPDVAEAHATLGDIYLRQGKLDAAEAALRAELRSHPEDYRAKHTLAVVLDLNRKPQQALEVLGPLLEAKPDLADGRYLLGKILLAQGAAEEARAQLEAAAELAPEDANIRYQLAQAYQRLGQREKASREFEEYRRLKKESRREEGP